MPQAIVARKEVPRQKKAGRRQAGKTQGWLLVLRHSGVRLRNFLGSSRNRDCTLVEIVGDFGAEKQQG